jgi:gas vesicle protein
LSSGGFLAGLAVGVVVGTAVTMLFTPRSGAQTRGQLERWRNARRQGRVPTSTTDELIELGLDAADLVRGRFDQALAAARAASAEARVRLLREWEERRSGGRPDSGSSASLASRNF